MSQTNSQKSGFRKTVRKAATDIFIKRKKSSAELSKPLGTAGVSKIRKVKSVTELANATQDLSLSPRVTSIGDLTDAAQDLDISPEDLPPPVPRIPVNLPNQPSDYARSSGWAKSLAATSAATPRLLSQRSTPALRDRSSRKTLRTKASQQNMLKTVKHLETAKEWLDRINDGGSVAWREEYDKRHIDATDNRYFYQQSSLDQDPTAEMPDTDDTPPVPTICDLSNMDGYTISLFVRILGVETSDDIAAPRLLKADRVPTFAMLCASVNKKSAFSAIRAPVRCEMVFEDVRELIWEKGINGHHEVYQEFLEGLKSQGERHVLLQSDAFLYEFNESGMMVEHETKNIEVTGHVTLYYTS